MDRIGSLLRKMDEVLGPLREVDEGDDLFLAEGKLKYPLHQRTSHHAEGTYLEPEEVAYTPRGSQVRRGAAKFADGKVRPVRAGIPDTYSTIPAHAKVKGRRVTGYLTMNTKSGLSTATKDDPAFLQFHHYKEHDDLLGSRKKSEGLDETKRMDIDPHKAFHVVDWHKRAQASGIKGGSFQPHPHLLRFSVVNKQSYDTSGWDRANFSKHTVHSSNDQQAAQKVADHLNKTRKKHEGLGEAVGEDETRYKIDMNHPDVKKMSQGVPGSHWKNIVRKELKYGDGTVQVVRPHSDTHMIVAGSAMSGLIMGGVAIHKDALKPVK